MDRDRENREEREAALCLQERQKLGNVERERERERGGAGKRTGREQITGMSCN
jgi:hypothetical protein